MADLQCPFCEKSYKVQRFYDAHIEAKHSNPVAGSIPKAAPTKQQEYVCMAKCWHNGKLWHRGDRAVFTDNYPKDKRGKLLHFEPVDPELIQPEPEERVVTVTGASE